MPIAKDTLTHIFTFFAANNVAKMAEVCEEWKSAAEEPSLWALFGYESRLEFLEKHNSLCERTHRGAANIAKLKQEQKSINILLLGLYNKDFHEQKSIFGIEVANLEYNGYKLRLHDIAGIERFSNIIPGQFRDKLIIFITADKIEEFKSQILNYSPEHSLTFLINTPTCTLLSEEVKEYQSIIHGVLTFTKGNNEKFFANMFTQIEQISKLKLTILKNQSNEHKGCILS